MVEKKQLRWMCRRGMLELDLWLEDIIDHHYDTMPEKDQALFIEMLKTPDPELMDWFLGRAIPENSDYERLLAQIKSAA